MKADIRRTVTSVGGTASRRGRMCGETPQGRGEIFEIPPLRECAAGRRKDEAKFLKYAPCEIVRRDAAPPTRQWMTVPPDPSLSGGGE